MKFKIGNDIIETERIKKLCEKYGDKFKTRIYTNNEINLEWVTKRMNNQHAYDVGLRKGRGITIRVLETGKIYNSIFECANAIGMSPLSVKYSLRYGTKTRSGLSFEYVN